MTETIWALGVERFQGFGHQPEGDGGVVGGTLGRGVCALLLAGI